MESQGTGHPVVPGILVLYHRPFAPNASTVMEHVNAFKRYSQFSVWNVNTELGFPHGLEAFRFQVLVLHYSIFAPGRYHLDGRFLDFLERHRESYKIAFFQDEYHYCQPRFEFLNRHNINCVYTLLEPEYIPLVYGKYTAVEKYVYSLPGYVNDDLVAVGNLYTKPDHERQIDIGYRGRRLSYYMGAGAQEKYDIAEGFRRRAASLSLCLDIEAEEQRRIYGMRWYQFMANCRAVLGVEAGVSIFDLEDILRTETDRMLVANPRMDFAQLSDSFLHRWEGNIYYRTISPRHFEAAALRVTQILFEGRYSGILDPMVHYIPLRKDFSNFDEVIARFSDRDLRHRLAENTYRDLIASGRYTYKQFVEDFDADLLRAGYHPTVSAEQAAQVNAILHQGRAVRQLRGMVRATRYYPFPGRGRLVAVVRRYRRLRQRLQMG